MKQNLPPAISHAPLGAWVICAVALFVLACATPARRAASGIQSTFEAGSGKSVSVVNINTATPQQLEELPGVGKIIAERIVAHRQQYGPFRRAEHLMMVRGISDSKFRKIRPWIVVE
jgi:competence protein ComEA